MKLIFIIPLLFAFQVFSQKAIFKEKKLYANPKYFNPKEKYATIIIPIVITKKSAIDKMINDKIKNEAFSLEDGQDFTSGIKAQINDGLTDVSYEVTFNKNYILSLSIYLEGSGGNHITFYTAYFNFDLRTGKEIVLSDLIKKEKIDSFKAKVFQDRNDSISEYKQEEFKLIKDKIIDSSDYQWIVGMLDDENERDEGFGEIFSLSAQGIEIIEPIEFPSAMRSQEPAFQLKYSFNSIKSIINSKFLDLLTK